MNPVDFLYSTCRERQRRKLNPNAALEQHVFLGGDLPKQIGGPLVDGALLDHWRDNADTFSLLAPENENQQPTVYSAGSGVRLSKNGWYGKPEGRHFYVKDNPTILGHETGELYLRWQCWINVWGWVSPVVEGKDNWVSMYHAELHGIQQKQIEVLMSTQKAANKPDNIFKLRVNWINQNGVAETFTIQWPSTGYGTVNWVLRFKLGQAPRLEVNFTQDGKTQVLTQGAMPATGPGLLTRPEGIAYVGKPMTSGTTIPGWGGLLARFAFGNKADIPIP